MAYLPVVAFYHWGKVVYKFNLEDSYEEMVDQLVKMTGRKLLETVKWVYTMQMR